MRRAGELRRRLDAIASQMKGTFAARLAKLTPDERATYGQWKARTAAHHSRSETPAAAYERLLSGDCPPVLSHTIRVALFGPILTITNDMTETEIAEVYRRLALEV